MTPRTVKRSRSGPYRRQILVVVAALTVTVTVDRVTGVRRGSAVERIIVHVLALVGVPCPGDRLVVARCHCVCVTASAIKRSKLGIGVVDVRRVLASCYCPLSRYCRCVVSVTV